MKALPSQGDVIIIGGGLAGLSAGVALSERGCRVIVLERDQRLGGRAQSWTDPSTGDPVHIGPHILLSAYPNMRWLMRQLGTEDRVRWLTDAFIHLVEGTEVYPVRGDSRLPPPLHFLPALSVAPGLSAVDLASNTRAAWTALRMDEAGLEALDDETALLWLRRMGVTEHAIRRSWGFIVMAILNVPLELCSAGALVRFLRELLSHGDVQIGLPTCGLGDLFAPQAQAWIEARGGAVAVQTAVKSLRAEGRRVVGVETSDGHTLRAPWVIFAAPPAALGPLLPEPWRADPTFAELGRFVPCPYVSVTLWFDRKLTQMPFWARLPAPGEYNCDFYDLSNISSAWPADRSIITSNIIWSHRAAGLSDADVVAATRRELAELLPEAAHAGLRHSVVQRIPLAVHCPFPGVERHKPDTRTPFDGLLLAGDWVKTGLPSSMEGACHAGLRAAERVLEARGAPTPLVQASPPPEGLARWIGAWPRRRSPAR